VVDLASLEEEDGEGREKRERMRKNKSGG